MGFMGWWAERDSAGRWFACKIAEREGYGAVGLVRYRHRMADLAPDASKLEAEREIRKLYQLGLLQ